MSIPATKPVPASTGTRDLRLSKESKLIHIVLPQILTWCNSWEKKDYFICLKLFICSKIICIWQTYFMLYWSDWNSCFLPSWSRVQILVWFLLFSSSSPNNCHYSTIHMTSN